MLGPHGVDDLLRKAMDACWREYPEDRRNFENVRRRVLDVFDRNMKVWSGIKKPSPAAFFEDLLPHAADGYMRQAMVLTWMMMPRAGGRNFSDVKRMVAHIFQRTLAGWDEDNATFSGSAKQSKLRPRPRKPAARPRGPGEKKQEGGRTRSKAATKAPAKRAKPAAKGKRR